MSIWKSIILRFQLLNKEARQDVALARINQEGFPAARGRGIDLQKKSKV